MQTRASGGVQTQVQCIQQAIEGTPPPAPILQNLRELRLVNEEDYIGSRTVLRAAAMTYVAALATAVASLLRVLVIARRR